MTRPTSILIVMLICGFLAVGVFFLVDLGGQKNFATPEEVFDAARAALQKNDIREFCQCLTTDSRDLLAATVIAQEFSMRKDGDAKPEDKAHIRAAADVFEKHGLTEEFLTEHQKEQFFVSHPQAPMENKLEAAQKLLVPVKDRNGLIADTMQATQKADKSDGSPFGPLKDAKIVELKLTSKTTAMAAVAIKGAKSVTPMSFRKQADSWRLELFEDRPQPKMPGMPPGHP